MCCLEEVYKCLFSVVYVYLDHLRFCVLWSCRRLWSGCEFVVVPYVDEVVAVTVIRVLLFMLHVCLLRECDGVS